MILDPIGFLDGNCARYYSAVFKCFGVGIVLVLAYGCMIAGSGKPVPDTAAGVISLAPITFIIMIIFWGYTSPFHAGAIGLVSFAVIYAASSRGKDDFMKSLKRTWRITFALELFLFLCLWFHAMYIYTGPLLSC